MIGIIKAAEANGDEAEANDKTKQSPAAGHVPLIRHECHGNWRPAHPQISLPTRNAAVITCIDHVVLLGRELHDDARLLRVVCEHPQFEFSNDLIDSSMIHTRALAIETTVGKLTANLERLLEPPDPSDRVEIDGQRMSADEHGALAPLVVPEHDAADDWSDESWMRSPGPTLGVLLTRLVGYAQESRGYPLTDGEVDEAVSGLDALRPPREPEAEAEATPEAAASPEPPGAEP